MYPPAKRRPITIPISIIVGLINWDRFVFVIIALIKIKLLEMPNEYAEISINPNGDKNRIDRGEMWAISGIDVTIAANAYPVDQEENNPQKIPNPGINIGSAIVVLCTKMPMHQYLILIFQILP